MDAVNSLETKDKKFGAITLEVKVDPEFQKQLDDLEGELRKLGGLE
jgi:hypothetical protein